MSRLNRPAARDPRAQIALIIALLALLSASTMAAPLPRGLSELIPESLGGIVVFRSLEESEREIGALLRRIDPEEAPDFDLSPLAGTIGVELYEAIDRSRPVALVIGMPSPATMQPGVSVLAPAAAGYDEARIGALLGQVQPHMVDGYFHLPVMPDEGYAPAGGLPAWLEDLPEGDAVLRLDLSGLLEFYRPMIDMGLGMALAPPPSGAEPDPERLTPEQVEAIMSLLRALMDSLSRLDLALDISGDEVEIEVGALMHGGSPLSMRTQPEFDEALSMSHLVAEFDAMRVVSAYDVSGPIDHLISFYEVFLDSPALEMPESFRQSYADLMKQSRSMYELYSYPFVMAMDIGDDGFDYSWVIKGDRGDLLLEKLLAYYADPALAEAGFAMQETGRTELAGVEVRSYEMSIDADAMMEGNGAQPAEVSEEERRQFADLMDSILPPLQVASVGEYALVRSGAQPDAILPLLKSLRQRGEAPASVRDLANWAGNGVQQVVEFDLGKITNMVMRFMPQSAGVDWDGEIGAVPVHMAALVRGEDQRTKFRMDAGQLGSFIATLRELDAVHGGVAGPWTPDDDTPMTPFDDDADDDAEETGMAPLSSEEATALADEIMPIVEKLRGLAFKRPVPVKVVDDEAARAHFASRLEMHMPEDQLRAEGQVYKHLGLVAADYDLVAEIFALLEEQAAGYYDPESETFFMLSDMPKATAPIIMAHELTHALDDQHFDIDGMLERYSEDEDRMEAIGAVVEGSGTLVMSRYMMQEMMAGRIGAEMLEAYQESEAGKSERLDAAPEVLKRALVAPYLLGQAFVLRGNPMNIMADIEAADLNRAFEDGPRSFEQIIHPEKFWEEATRDEPRAVKLEGLVEILGSGWSVVADGAMGELELALLTGSEELNIEGMAALSASAWTTDAATGWGGDAWQLLGDGDRMLTVLGTLWDSEEDAAEFVSALRLGPHTHVHRDGDAVVVVAGDLNDEGPPLAERALASMR